VCNDVSSRSIEGENPLYLPQAKVYAGSCALATGIRPAWELDISRLSIDLDVTRDGVTVWAGQVDTGQIRRPPSELVHYLYAEEQFPDGAVLSTGTGIVPGMEFGLADGDEVTVSIDGIGALRNVVRTGKPSFAWLADGGTQRLHPD
jgi:2-dehydro-3-deoxy-D-arabinonate dehydratase